MCSTGRTKKKKQKAAAAESAAAAEKDKQAAARIRKETAQAKEAYIRERMAGKSGQAMLNRKSALGMEQFGRQRYRSRQTGEAIPVGFLEGTEYEQYAKQIGTGKPVQRAAGWTWLEPNVTYRTVRSGDSAGERIITGGSGYTWKKGYGDSEDRMVWTGPMKRGPKGEMVPDKRYERQRVRTPAETAGEYSKRLEAWQKAQAKLSEKVSVGLGEYRDRMRARGRRAEEQRAYKSRETTGQQAGERKLAPEAPTLLGPGEREVKETTARRTEASTAAGVPTKRRRYGPFGRKKRIGSA